MKKLLLALFFTLLFSSAANADMNGNWFAGYSPFMTQCPHFYLGGSIGVSHLFDRRAPGSVDSVRENGPGWNVNAGYQWNDFWGAELGYNQYHASRETVGSVFGTITVAQTEHYSAYLAATLHLRWPTTPFSVFGKLGAAYSYANKIFIFGPSASSGSVAPYYGLGVAYAVSRKVDFLAQWTRAQGNHLTGSADLWSLGFNYAIG